MKIFESNGDIAKNAYLNWNTYPNDIVHNFYILAKDFEEAAKTMLNAVLSNNIDKKADNLIMPIFYCINQSIEVYIKAVIMLINRIEKKNEKSEVTHDIQCLYNKMINAIEKDPTEDLINNFSILKDYIDELYVHIKKPLNSKPKMDFARYPVDTTGKPYFYIETTENVVVNVEELNKKFETISSTLEAIYAMYEKEWENRNEQTNI